jgi:hypothetical protein
MSGAKHSPGRWTAVHSPKGTLHVGPIVGSPSGVVAFISYDGAPRGDSTETRANALLIAAAPELLEALREAHELLTDPDGDEFKATALEVRIGALLARVQS